MELFDDAVLDDRGVALRTHPHAEARSIHLEAHRLGQLGVAVGQHGDLVGLVPLAPRLHHEGIVDPHARDGVDTLRQDGVCFLHETGEMAGVSSRREGPSHPEQDHLAASEELARGNVFHVAVGHLLQRDLG